MKKLVFSKHGQRRAKERGISEDWAAETINRAEGTINVKFGRKASYKRFGDDYVVVIYEESVDKITVVTIMKVNKERLERYGFGGIR
jgi:hypothetical protein